MTQKTEIALASSGGVGFVEKMLLAVESFDKAKELGQFIINSGFAPKHFEGKPESVVLAIDAGKKLGFDWFQSLQEGYIVNGIPGYKGKALKGLVLASGLCERWDTEFTGSIEAKNLTCIIKYKRKGSSEQTRSYGMQDAITAQLWGPKKKYDNVKKAWVEYADAWVKFPKDMLEWKCVSRVLNDFADITKGFRPVEDLQDYEQEVIQVTGDGMKITAPVEQPMNTGAKKSIKKPRISVVDVEHEVVNPVEENAVEVAEQTQPNKEPDPAINREYLSAMPNMELLALCAQTVKEKTGHDVNEVLFSIKPEVRKKSVIIDLILSGDCMQSLLNHGAVINTATDDPDNVVGNEDEGSNPFQPYSVDKGVEREFDDVLAISDIFTAKADIDAVALKAKELGHEDLDELISKGDISELYKLYQSL